MGIWCRTWDVAGASEGNANVPWFRLGGRTRLQCMCCACRQSRSFNFVRPLDRFYWGSRREKVVVILVDIRTWVRQFALSFLSLLLGHDFLDSHLLSLWGVFGSSCFNAFIETFFLVFCGFPSPTLYLLPDCKQFCLLFWDNYLPSWLSLCVFLGMEFLRLHHSSLCW